MKSVVWRLCALIVGLFSFIMAMVFEVDGTLGFLMVTIGLFLVILSIPFRGLIELLLP